MTVSHHFDVFFDLRVVSELSNGYSFNPGTILFLPWILDSHPVNQLKGLLVSGRLRRDKAETIFSKGTNLRNISVYTPFLECST